MVEAFRQELRQLGYVEGQNLSLEMRLSRPNTNDLAGHVQELAGMGLDVVVAAALPIALAFRKLNTSTPMVIGTGPALVRNGLAESMGRPGRKTTGLDALEPALESMRAHGINGLVNFQGALSLVNRERITAFAAQYGIPAIYQSRHFVDAGGLMALAPDQDEQFRAAARSVDKILKGADAGSLPIRYPDRYFLTINQRVAKKMALEIPPGLLERADEIVR